MSRVIEYGHPHILVAPPDHPGVLVTADSVSLRDPTSLEWHPHVKLVAKGSGDAQDLTTADTGLSDYDKTILITSNMLDPRQEIRDDFRTITGTTFAAYPGARIRMLIRGVSDANLTGLFEGCQARVPPFFWSDFSIGIIDRMYAGCSNVEKVEILATRTTTTVDTFKGCSSLREIHLYGFGGNINAGNVLDVSETAIPPEELARMAKQNFRNVGSWLSPKPVVRIRQDQISDAAREMLASKNFELEIAN